MPSPNQFHPEFGYMCPTSRFRRTLRVSLVAAVIGAAAGAIGVVATAERGDRMRSEIAATIGVGEPAVAAPAAGVPAAALPCPTRRGAPFDSRCPPPAPARTAASPTRSPADLASAAVDAAVEAAPGDFAAVKPATTHAKKNGKPVQRRDARSGYASPYESAPYGLHYEQGREGRGLVW